MFSMDWKSTAVISGAGVLATWFFSMPPAQQPVSVPTAAPARADRAQSATIDIQQEAARLQQRAPATTRYSEPSRNPFRFSERRSQPARPPVAAVAPVAAPVVPPPPPEPTIALDGVASDTVDGVMQRTAILNTTAGVILAKEGEQVLGYKVDKVAPDSVELTKVSDGSVLRLGLR
jgi:hypothetical protein